MFRDLFWMAMLFGVMAVITASALSHSATWRQAEFAPDHVTRPPAMVETPARTPTAAADDQESAGSVTLASLPR